MPDVRAALPSRGPDTVNADRIDIELRQRPATRLPYCNNPVDRPAAHPDTRAALVQSLFGTARENVINRCFITTVDDLARLLLSGGHWKSDQKLLETVKMPRASAYFSAAKGAESPSSISESV